MTYGRVLHRFAYAHERHGSFRLVAAVGDGDGDGGRRGCAARAGDRCPGDGTTGYTRLIQAARYACHDEWTEARRYLGLELLARARTAIAPDTTEEASTEIVPALSA